MKDGPREVRRRVLPVRVGEIWKLSVNRGSRVVRRDGVKRVREKKREWKLDRARGERY